MNSPENKQNESDNQESSLESLEKSEQSNNDTKNRLAKIYDELGSFNYKAKSQEEITELQTQRNEEYQKQIKDFDDLNLSEESKEIIQSKMVNDVIEQAQQENEKFAKLNIQKTILENINDTSFRQKISPTKYDGLTEDTFNNALEQITTANIDLSKSEKLKLFRETLEYYSNPNSAKKPWWHSTGSYSLRKGLEEGFSGGHSDEAGEGSLFYKKGNEKQKHLSISHTDNPSAETFQQIFARISASGDINEYLKINSEVLTGKKLPQQFLEEFFSSLSEEEKNKLAVDKINTIINIKRGLKQKYPNEELWPDKDDWVLELSPNLEDITTNDLTPETYDKIAGEEAKNAFVNTMNNRKQVPLLELIKNNILPEIKDTKLRETLLREAEHPFPCFITFEGADKNDKLYTEQYGKNPTHIPFEDFYLDSFQGEDIKEIRVPENKINQVREWLDEKSLKNVKLVPLEVFEVKRVIESNIQ